MSDGVSLPPLQVGHYLDRHLVFPLLEFLQVQGVYPEPEILQAKIDLLQKTNMVDFALDIHATLHGPDTPNAGALRPSCVSAPRWLETHPFAPLRPGGPASGGCEQAQGAARGGGEGGRLPHEPGAGKDAAQRQGLQPGDAAQRAPGAW